MSKAYVSFVAVVALFIALAAPVAAQTTGTIEGTVLDPGKVPLPGVAIEATSTSLQGSRTAVTNALGRFRLSHLPPGAYTVTAKLAGFATQQHNVQLGLDKVATLELALAATRTEVVTVTAESTPLEIASNTVGSNLDQKVIQSLPTGRNYSSVAQLAAGTSQDESDSRNGSITVYGSTGLENSFLVDGVNTTGVEFGSQGKVLNFEFIQELQMKTGGYEAEHGGATGGIVNVVTKSGGNEFHGDVFGYFDNGSLQADNKHTDEVVESGVVTGFRRSDFGADVGGFVVKDRIWFFGAYDRVDNSIDKQVTQGPVAGINAPLDVARDLFAVKLTIRANDRHSLIATVFGDPETDTGAVQDPIGPPSTYEGTNEIGGTDYSIRYEGILTDTWLATAQYARHAEKSNIIPGNEGRQIRFEDNRGETIVADGGFGRYDDREFTRDDFRLDSSFFVGAHELKAGLEYEKMDADVARGYTGGQLVTLFDNPEDPARTIYQHYYWTTENATSDPWNAPSVEFTAKPNHKQISVFLQDRWRALPNLTLNGGLRWEQQEIVSKFGTTAFKVDHLSPRFGFSWDPLKDGKNKVYGSYGQFVEAIPMDMNIRSFSAERNPTVYNFDVVSLVPNPAAEAIVGSESVILGGYIEPVDPDLKAQYLDEIIFGIEREVIPSLAVGVRGIYRRYGRVIEDGFIEASGDYFIMNPGEGTLGSAYPKARRHFRGLEFTAEKRLGRDWQVFASYLLSRLEGNYDGAFRATDGQKDPNINADFDYPEFLINNDGDLTLDRRHQVKFQASYTMPFHLTASLSGYYRTGAPRTRLGWFDNYGRPELYLTTRGAEGRTPAIYELDLHLGYPLVVGPVTVNFLLDLFNALNKQEAITVDNRYAFTQAENENPTPGNARYGLGRTFQEPRTLRLGARISF